MLAPGLFGFASPPALNIMNQRSPRAHYVSAPAPLSPQHSPSLLQLLAHCSQSAPAQRDNSVAPRGESHRRHPTSANLTESRLSLSNCRQETCHVHLLHVSVCEPGGAGDPPAAVPDHGGGAEGGTRPRPGTGTIHRPGEERPQLALWICVGRK